MEHGLDENGKEAEANTGIVPYGLQKSVADTTIYTILTGSLSGFNLETAWHNSVSVKCVK